MSGRSAMGRLCWLAVAGLALAGLLAAPASARSASPEPLRLAIFLPAPGRITLESVSATVRNPSAALRRSGLLNPRVLDVGSLPPSVKILYLRRTFRTRGSVKSVLLLLVINRASPKGAARAFAAGNGLPGPLLPRCNPAAVAAAGCDWELNPLNLNVFRRGQSYPTSFLYLGQEENSHQVSVQALLAFTADFAKTQKQAAEVKQVINPLFGHVPSGSDFQQLLTESTSTTPALNVGTLDNGHAFAWSAPSHGTFVGLAYAVAHDQPQHLVSDFEVVLHVDLNNDGKIGSSPSKQQLYRFSFGPLGLTFDDTVPVQGGQPEIEHWSVQIKGGTACGTNLATAAFEVPWILSVNGGSPQQRTAQESFAVNPFRFYNFSDTSNNSTLAMNLRLVTGSSPSVQFEETHSGLGITNVSVNPQQAAVTATPVSSTC